MAERQSRAGLRPALAGSQTWPARAWRRHGRCSTRREESRSGFYKRKTEEGRGSEIRSRFDLGLPPVKRIGWIQRRTGGRTRPGGRVPRFEGLSPGSCLQTSVTGLLNSAVSRALCARRGAWRNPFRCRWPRAARGAGDRDGRWRRDPSPAAERGTGRSGPRESTAVVVEVQPQGVVADLFETCELGRGFGVGVRLG